MPTTSLDFDNSWKKTAEKTKSEESALSTGVSAGQVRECLRLGASRWRAADHLELILQRSLLLLAVFPVPLLLSFPFWFFHMFFPLYLSYLMQKKALHFFPSLKNQKYFWNLRKKSPPTEQEKLQGFNTQNKQKNQTKPD